MNQSHARLSWFFALPILLSACGGGGSEVLLGGIEGSGITTFGAVTALGSIHVNDVEYDIAEAAITINGTGALESDLAPGSIVIVEGRLEADGQRGVASRVAVEIAVAGPVSAVDIEQSRLTILGQTISIDASTIIAGGIEARPLGGLEVGRTVEVSGFADSTGLLHATRIDSRQPSTSLVITGHVADIDTGARTFLINGQIVNYTTATLSGFESLLEDLPVRVVGAAVDQGILLADEIVVRDNFLPGERGDVAVVQGWVTRFASARDFDVGGYRVVATDETTTDGPIDGVEVQLDAFVSVTGELVGAGVVQAATITAVLPGRLIGSVEIAEREYSINGILTPDGTFRLNIEEEFSPGWPVEDSGLGQLVGSLNGRGRAATGTGVLIGEACGLAPAARFCGMRTPVRVELTKDARVFSMGASGVARIATGNGEETWPLHLGYWGAQAGFYPFLSWSELQGVYEIHQAEFAHSDSVIMSVDGEGTLFFQSAETGCIGNGAIRPYGDGTLDIYNVTLTLESCAGAFAYLNAEFRGLSTLEGLTPWDYNFTVLQMWVSTPPGAESSAAITLWADSYPYITEAVN